MQTFTIKNAVILSLVQVVIVVMGTLAAGLSYKLFKVMMADTPPLALSLLRNGGVMLLSVPLVWVSLAAWARLNERLPDKVKGWVFLSGFGCVVLLVVLIGWVVFSPWVFNAHYDRIGEPSGHHMPN